MNENRIINICIASPGDIIIERKIVREVCLGMNDEILPNEFGVTFNVTLWEYVFPTDKSPQEIIDHLAEHCDVFICIFHKKFHNYFSEEEKGALQKFLSAYDSWKALKKPHFIFFFKNITISSLNEIKDPELIGLLDLKDKIKANSSLICNEFAAPYEFCEKIHDQILMYLSETIKTSSDKTNP